MAKLKKSKKIKIAVGNFYVYGYDKLKQPLTKAEERSLFNDLNNGCQKARDLLIEHNLRLVASIAFKYINNYKVPTDDLISYGIFGLIKAIDKFDLNRNVAFSTYATHWIHRYVSNSLVENANLISVPHYMVSLSKYLESAVKVLKNKLNRPPTNKETIDYIKCEFGQEVTLNQLEYAKQAIIATKNVFEDFNGFSDSYWCDENDQHRLLETAESLEQLSKSFHVLNEREKMVINYRFGIGCNSKKLREVGEIMKITRERVRQIELQALKKLRMQMTADHA